MRLTRLVALTALVLLITTPVFADATFFIGGASAPTTRLAKGFAVGFGLLFVGFEFEYSNTSEDLAKSAPNVRTGMGNVLLQTPFAIHGFQPYFTVGAGGYREKLGDIHQETNFGMNTGGGVKISIIGPLRARVDYRVFTLKGSPLNDVSHRVYVGANLNF